MLHSPSGLDKLLRHATDTGRVPGVIVMVCDRDATLYEGAFGQRKLHDRAPMTLDTVTAIMSMTKPVTAVAAMQLVELGRLELDTPAGDILPEIDGSKVLTGFADDGAPRLRPPASRITLRQLLSHTSGFGYDIWNRDLMTCIKHEAVPDIATGLKAALHLPLLFDPGTDTEYGIGIDWVGLLIEAVTGSTLGRFVEANITTPLGMTDTAFTATPEMTGRRASVHMRGPDGALTAIALRTPQAPEYEQGGGGLLSCAGDYLRFIQMLLGDGERDGARILQSASVAEMARNQIGDLRVKPLRSAVPRISNDAEFFRGTPKTWGLSFQITEADADTGRLAGTLMWAGLTNTYFWVDRAAGIGGVFLTAILPFADHEALSLYYETEREVYRQILE